jgi:hypothetical protein
MGEERENFLLYFDYFFYKNLLERSMGKNRDRLDFSLKILLIIFKHQP